MSALTVLLGFPVISVFGLDGHSLFVNYFLNTVDNNRSDAIPEIRGLVKPLGLHQFSVRVDIVELPKVLAVFQASLDDSPAVDARTNVGEGPAADKVSGFADKTIGIIYRNDTQTLALFAYGVEPYGDDELTGYADIVVLAVFANGNRFGY